MTKKFINVQIPLVELSSDSEEGADAQSQSPQPPPPSPAASHTHSSTHTPRYLPAVSDDATSDTPIPAPRHRSPHLPAHRSPTPQPPALVPAPAPIVPSPAPRVPYQPRMSTGPRPPYRLAPRDFPAEPYPHSTFERGESSRQPDYGSQITSLSVGLRDVRYSFYPLQESQTRLLDRMGMMETEMMGWRQTVDARAQTLADGIQRNHAEFVRRTSLMERLLLVALVMAVVAMLVVLLPYLLPRE